MNSTWSIKPFSRPIAIPGSGLDEPAADRNSAAYRYANRSYGSLDSEQPVVPVGSVVQLDPLMRRDSIGPLVHSPGIANLQTIPPGTLLANYVEAGQASGTPSASPQSDSDAAHLLSPPTSVESGAVWADPGDRTSSLTNRQNPVRVRLVSPDTYLLHLDAKNSNHVERFEEALSALRRYGRMAVPALIASGSTALYCAFGQLNDDHVGLKLGSGLVGLAGIGAAIGLAFSLSAMTRVYDVQEPAGHDVENPAAAVHDD